MFNSHAPILVRERSKFDKCNENSGSLMDSHTAKNSRTIPKKKKKKTDAETPSLVSLLTYKPMDYYGYSSCKLLDLYVNCLCCLTLQILKRKKYL